MTPAEAAFFRRTHARISRLRPEVIRALIRAWSTIVASFSESELAQIIDSAEADVVVIGTPIDLRRVIEIRKPAVRVRYDLEVLPDSPSLLDVLKPVLG